METLIKSALIVDPNSKHNGKKRDILIVNGVIKSIKAKIDAEKAKVISEKGLCVSPGWFDLCSSFRDPGHEYKEDINSGLNAAAKGGFTGVMIMPNTSPPISTKSNVEYAYKRAQGHVTDLVVSGAASAGLEGLQLSEMMDMHDAGAKAFTDYKKSISVELLNRVLEYSRNFNGLIMTFPYEQGVCPHGQVHEGKVSVSLGLIGIPALAEELRLSRDIELLRYTKSKLHVLLVSTAKSVALVKQAKKEGLNISCGVAAHQISFLDEDLSEFDTRLKVLPPFRSKEDRKALINGLKDGTIDVICSDHSPEDTENKKTEFQFAAFGISSVETAFSSVYTSLEGKLELESLIEKISINPRKLLGLAVPEVMEDEKANLSLFTTEIESTFNLDTMLSKSKNSPFGGVTLKGKAIGVVNNKQVHLTKD